MNVWWWRMSVAGVGLTCSEKQEHWYERGHNMKQQRKSRLITKWKLSWLPWIEEETMKFLPELQTHDQAVILSKTKKTNSQMWVWTWHSTGKLGQSCNDQVKNQWTQGSRNAWGDSASWNWHLLGKLSPQLFRCIYHVGQSRNNFSILPGLQPTVRVDPQHLGFQHSKHLHHAFWSPSAQWSLDSLLYPESHSVQQINW